MYVQDKEEYFKEKERTLLEEAKDIFLKGREIFNKLLMGTATGKEMKEKLSLLKKVIIYHTP